MIMGPATLLGFTAPALSYAVAISSQSEKAQAVKKAFELSWKGYHENAFPHDTLKPIARSYENDRNGWGVTAIDSLTTAIIMGESDIVDQILDFAPQIDFTTTVKVNETISVFESNIRYLGGYDLLKGPMSSMAPSDSARVDALLEQAKSLAESLSVAFDTPSGVHTGEIILNPFPQRSGDGTNSIAGMGTLVLEWTRLSDLTGNPKYATLAQRAEDHLLNPKGKPEAFPGLVGSSVSVETGEFLDSSGGWSGGTDSFYEYLIKMYLYNPDTFGRYRDRWVAAADSTMEHLASHPSSRKDLTFLAAFNGSTLRPQSGHLASFAGGNFILGGILLKEQKYIDFGIELANSYYSAYTSTASGIGPEGFQWTIAGDDSTGGAPPGDWQGFYDKAGFWVTSSYYILRPETVESLYYAYRVTGDSKYQDFAWDAFQRIQTLCRSGVGYAGLADVTVQSGSSQYDLQESFWAAETLKYLYLIFAPESPLQVSATGPNEYVYNTEAHPFKVRSR
ncbi:mannosyl-oligosaccharide alpha-1,2-mannosidase [Geosmithia morbida]|uniref:alpha-1,2-Mannosidase n=1 Tax=Geosmithia morbida TaxID=1094350 RepID=A0A9P4YZ75_9HYPO|nr:mannosyl-oligosaccharide alpha-1,2-mannosidase [Geosmithia morbida]KAF4125781.1 mannosyl-oligosaccharide alpha-1,2-mannosidase [Geosmithia morbida]